MWEITSERRAAPRRRINLEFRVLLIATKMSAAGEEQTLPLIGYTRDISESGLGLIVSTQSMNVLYGLGQSYTLHLVLTLHVGSVELEMTPVRYQHINEGGSATHLLIGAQITKMSDEDHVKFVEYLESFP
jgi:hypothetical protein